MIRTFYCAYASDTLATSAITRFASGSLEVQTIDDGEPIPEEAIFFYTDPKGSFNGHHMRHIRVEGADKIGHLVNRGFKIPDGVSATEVIALRPIPAHESTLQRERRQRGTDRALDYVHFAVTGSCINGFRSVRERKRIGRNWREDHLAKRRESRYSSFACAYG